MRIKKLLLVIFITITSNGVGQFNTCFFYPSSVDLFGLCEISFKLPKVYSNPYDPDTICVYAEFTGPDNSVYRVDGFYYEDYTFHQHNEGYEVSTHNSSSDGWRIRFTPSQVGTWTFIIQAFDADGCLNMSFMNESHTFSCTIVRKADGFISKANSRFLKREVVENGQKRFRSFFPVGPNVAWYSCKKNNQGYEVFGQPLGIYDYERYIDSLSGFANYMRIWLNRYQYLSLYGREYTQIQNGAPTVYFDNTINQKDSAELDHIITYALQHGVSIMPCIFSYGDFCHVNNMDFSDPSVWGNNPYNTIINSANLFFEQEDAKRITKNLLRYIVSRWGYATNIMSWELWNEVSNMFKDWDDDTGSLQQNVLSWHNEMANYIRTIDPFGHCVSTSMGTTSKTHDNSPINYNRPLYLELFNNLDIVQQHNYQNIHKAKSAEQFSYVLYNKTTQAHWEYPSKPFFMGEFGFGQGDLYPAKDSFGIDLHNSLWSSLFSTSIGPASFWWWYYLDTCKLFHHFAPVFKFCRQLPILSETFTAHQTGVINAHKLVFPNNIETYYMINATEDTIIGWCQDTALCYQSLRWLTDSVQDDITKPHYLHFIDNAVFDPDGYVYKLLVEKRPAPSSTSNSIIIPITNHPVGTSYQLTWYNTETGLPEGSPLILQVSNFSDDQRYKAVSFRFPSTIRDIRNHSINNTFGDAVFVLVRTTS